MKKVVFIAFFAFGLLALSGCQPNSSSKKPTSPTSEPPAANATTETNESVPTVPESADSEPKEAPQTMDPAVAALVEGAGEAAVQENANAQALEEADETGPITGDKIDKLFDDEAADDSSPKSSNLTEEDVFGADKPAETRPEQPAEVDEAAEVPDGTAKAGSATGPAKDAANE